MRRRSRAATPPRGGEGAAAPPPAAIGALADHRAAWIALLAAAAGLVPLALVAHSVPFYGVETDLLAEYVPLARGVLSGATGVGALAARGPGYPWTLAVASVASGGDFFLGARLLNVAAALASLAAAYALVAGFLGRGAGLRVLLALLVTPAFLMAAIEAASDLPALALALAATVAVIRARSPRGAALAGLLAAAAILTRPNFISLLPAAAVTLALGTARARRALGYAAGVALPIGAWLLTLRAAGVDARALSRDALNMAFEFYGGGTGWERFGKRGALPFHTLLDVVRFAPADFFAHLAANLATRWLEDARRLLGPLFGWIALPGMALFWSRRPGWPVLVAHAVSAYVLLALVFYSPRFFLYLLPFYLAGAVALLDLAPGWLTARVGERRTRNLRRAGRVLYALGLVAGVALCAREAGRQLRGAPVEARAAGEALGGVAHAGERLMARKPHAAYYAGLEFVALPEFAGFGELLAAARASNARYLLVSPVEVALRPRLRFLAEGGVSLPGLAPVAQEWVGSDRFYALYRFTPATPDRAFDDSLLAALRRYVNARPGDGVALTQLGFESMSAGRLDEAVPILEAAEAASPADPAPSRNLALAHALRGEFDAAAAALERATARGTDPIWGTAFLGRLRLDQGRFAEARALLERAVRASPTNAPYLRAYAQACLQDGAPAEAARAFERYLGMIPNDPVARRMCADAWTRLGDPGRARAVLEGEGAPAPPAR